MSSIKQLIVNAILKVSTENPALNREGEPSAEEARDLFIARLMAELFPEHGIETSAVVVPVVAPEASPAKKPTKEEKAAAKAAKAEAKAAKVATPKTSPEAKAEAKAAKEAEKAAAKEAAKAAKEAEKEAAKAAKEAAKTAKKTPKAEVKVADVPSLPASPKPEAKPKKAKAEKPADDANVQKIDPTWRKHLKAAAKAANKEASKELESELLAYLNGLTKEAFNATKAEEHVKAFLAPAAPAAPQETVTELDAIEIDFNGKTYYVNPESKRVYEQDGQVFKAVGYAGMAAFAAMEIPEEA